MLYVFEVAQKLRISQQHVIDLIEEGKLRAVNVAGKNSTDRKFYRIPLDALASYLAEASTTEIALEKALEGIDK